jgi:rhamnose utilization protein RhaD (predicted bifunctional aldolase and dehydrogenase)
MPELYTLREVSAHIGRDPLLVQAAGGNTSLKQDDLMWIKASGTWLKDAIDKAIFVPLDLHSLGQALASDDPRCESCTDFVRHDLNQLGLRPSIETSVHGLMQQAVVLHVHCVNSIAWAIRRDAESVLQSRLLGFNWAFIPYSRPGLHLSRAIRERLKPNTDVLILGNHGLVVAADTVEAAKSRLDEVVKALRILPRTVSQPDFVALENIAVASDYRLPIDVACHGAALDAVALSHGCKSVYYPDHVVFLGTEIAQSLEHASPVVAIPGKGVLIHKNAKPAVEPMLRCVADVFGRVTDPTTLLPLSPTEIAALLDWDAEKYRQSIKS